MKEVWKSGPRSQKHGSDTSPTQSGPLKPPQINNSKTLLSKGSSKCDSEVLGSPYANEQIPGEPFKKTWNSLDPNYNKNSYGSNTVLQLDAYRPDSKGQALGINRDSSKLAQEQSLKFAGDLSKSTLSKAISKNESRSFEKNNGITIEAQPEGMKAQTQGIISPSILLPSFDANNQNYDFLNFEYATHNIQPKRDHIDSKNCQNHLPQPKFKNNIAFPEIPSSNRQIASPYNGRVLDINLIDSEFKKEPIKGSFNPLKILTPEYSVNSEINLNIDFDFNAQQELISYDSKEGSFKIPNINQKLDLPVKPGNQPVPKIKQAEIRPNLKRWDKKSFFEKEQQALGNSRSKILKSFDKNPLYNFKNLKISPEVNPRIPKQNPQRAIVNESEGEIQQTENQHKHNMYLINNGPPPSSAMRVFTKQKGQPVYEHIEPALRLPIKNDNSKANYLAGQKSSQPKVRMVDKISLLTKNVGQAQKNTQHRGDSISIEEIGIFYRYEVPKNIYTSHQILINNDPQLAESLYNMIQESKGMIPQLGETHLAPINEVTELNSCDFETKLDVKNFYSHTSGVNESGPANSQKHLSEASRESSTHQLRMLHSLSNPSSKMNIESESYLKPSDILAKQKNQEFLKVTSAQNSGNWLKPPDNSFKGPQESSESGNKDQNSQDFENIESNFNSQNLLKRIKYKGSKEKINPTIDGPGSDFDISKSGLDEHDGFEKKARLDFTTRLMQMKHSEPQKHDKLISKSTSKSYAFTNSGPIQVFESKLSNEKELPSKKQEQLSQQLIATINQLNQDSAHKAADDMKQSSSRINDRIQMMKNSNDLKKVPGGSPVIKTVQQRFAKDLHNYGTYDCNGQLGSNNAHLTSSSETFRPHCRASTGQIKDLKFGGERNSSLENTQHLDKNDSNQPMTLKKKSSMPTKQLSADHYSRMNKCASVLHKLLKIDQRFTFNSSNSKDDKIRQRSFSLKYVTAGSFLSRKMDVMKATDQGRPQSKSIVENDGAPNAVRDSTANLNIQLGLTHRRQRLSNLYLKIEKAIFAEHLRQRSHRLKKSTSKEHNPANRRVTEKRITPDINARFDVKNIFRPKHINSKSPNIYPGSLGKYPVYRLQDRDGLESGAPNLRADPHESRHQMFQNSSKQKIKKSPTFAPLKLSTEDDSKKVSWRKITKRTMSDVQFQRFLLTYPLSDRQIEKTEQTFKTMSNRQIETLAPVHDNKVNVEPTVQSPKSIKEVDDERKGHQLARQESTKKIQLISEVNKASFTKPSNVVQMPKFYRSSMVSKVPERFIQKYSKSPITETSRRKLYKAIDTINVQGGKQQQQALQEKIGIDKLPLRSPIAINQTNQKSHAPLPVKRSIATKFQPVNSTNKWSAPTNNQKAVTMSINHPTLVDTPLSVYDMHKLFNFFSAMHKKIEASFMQQLERLLVEMEALKVISWYAGRNQKFVVRNLEQFQLRIWPLFKMFAQNLDHLDFGQFMQSIQAN